MAKNNTFVFEGVTYKIKPITQEIQLESNKYYHLAFTEALNNGYKLRIEIEDMLKDRQLLNPEEDDKKLEAIRQEIKQLEINLRKGVKNGQRMSKQEGRELALLIVKKRQECANIGASIADYFSSSAENYAENERIQYWMYACTVLADTGDKAWKSFEVFKSDSNSKFFKESRDAFISSSIGVDKGYEKSLYENQWLLKMKFVDDQLRLIDEQGRLIDNNGRLINEDGRYIDDKGQFVDLYGNPIDNDGNLLIEDTWGVLQTIPVASEPIDSGKSDKNNNSPLDS